MNRLVLSRYEKNNHSFISYILLDENRKFVDFQLFNEDKVSLVNNIYAARVDKIVSGINAAFVTIANKQSCYLPLEDTKSVIYTNKHSNKESLCCGDEILVQVVKDAIKTKEPVVTTKLSIYGNYCVVTTDDTSIGVSKKIPKDIALDIRESIAPLVSDHEQDKYGIIIRTNARSVSQETLCNDIATTISLYNNIIKKAEYAVLYTRLLENTKDYLLKLYHLDFSTIDEVLTDQDDIYDELVAEFSSKTITDDKEHHGTQACGAQTDVSIKQTDMSANDNTGHSMQTNAACMNIVDKIHRYDDSAISLNLLYKLSSQIKELCTSLVWLNSGANIIIEQLETLSVIDVNSGRCPARKGTDILKINKEAATEAARQLRLRNISGMIIIDFINMKSKADEAALINHLKEELKKDSITCSFIDITKLGLVEITRKKEYKSLKETIL